MDNCKGANEYTNRINFLDVLRCISVFGIIILHLAAKNWYSTDIKSYEWNIFNFYDSCVRCFVPVFVMISGTLFLSKKYTIKDLYLKKISRISIAFIFWSLLYAIIFHYENGIKVIITEFLTGHFHLWFLIMIMSLYMLVPILKKIIESEQLTKYFLLIWFIFQLLIPQIINILNTLNYSTISNIIDTNYNKIQLIFGYSGYFILGYYLANKDFSNKQRKIIYLIGIIGITLTILLTIFESNKFGMPQSTYYSYFSINVAIVAIAIYVFSKYNLKGNTLFRNISKECFGIYLLHVLVYEMIYIFFKIDSLSINPIISIPVLAIVVFIISLLITKCIRLIPKVNKFII